MEEKRETIQEKRERLKALSAKAKAIIEASDDGELTINSTIIEAFYMDEKNQEFHSFKGWKDLGYSVKKGEKGYLIWGKPTKKNEKGETVPIIEKEKGKSTFFPISHIFSNAQVEPIKIKESA